MAMPPMNLNLTPAHEPPEGITSNFIDPPSLLPAAIAVAVIIQVLTIPFILARAYVNIFIAKRLRIEDCLSYLAYCGLIVYTVLCTHASVIGGAHHMWDISIAQFIRVLYIFNIVFINMSITTCLAKTVIFLQLKKIFTTRQRGIVFWIIIGSLVVNVIFYTIVTFLYTFACTPRERIWNLFTPGTCIDTNTLHLAGGSLNVISDIEALLVPAWAIWQLKMQLKKKIAVFAVFGIGIIAVTVGILGLVWRIKVIEGSDYTWLMMQTGLIGMAETAAVIIAGCCPCIPRLVRHVKGQASTRGGYSDGKRSSIMDKPPTNSNPFQKYLARDSAISQLASRTSEEHLQLHEYPKVDVDGNSGGSCISVERSTERSTSDEGRRIERTTHIVQITSNSPTP
ncbi:hypothetical protein P153DRAFT_363015 [Dothidotthia symphoricarpi CBS 119687]|uniref:Rhodopsin domain-containing protein n=1 Tax=Dothidotthia symphoricarpi CBS 119687 TaxID=1392245 RepID=A0A6A6APY9_9PLEO|nr:uncharacterized protein P153DRAFT_363015 [Dothidotthia symphoricarpi CBS 119687]KAF2133989.1 hypothetical protein P153DRAFT_363015 [Dothidotthia symphoricarpi CBS 119687]